MKLTPLEQAVLVHVVMRLDTRRAGTRYGHTCRSVELALDRLASKGAITGQRFPAATRAGFDAVIGKISRPKS